MTSRIFLLIGLLAIGGFLAGLYLVNNQPQIAPAEIDPPIEEKTIIVGQGDPEDPCTVEVSAAAYPELQEIGIDEWAAACRAAQAATNQ